MIGYYSVQLAIIGYTEDDDENDDNDDTEDNDDNCIDDHLFLY